MRKRGTDAFMSCEYLQVVMCSCPVDICTLGCVHVLWVFAGWDVFMACGYLHVVMCSCPVGIGK